MADLNNDSAIAELQELAGKIRNYQEIKKFSDAVLVRRFPALGSDKTYKKLLRGEAGELNIEKQLLSYRAVAALIETLTSEDREDEEFYADFVGPSAVKKALLETFCTSGNARFILAEGDTGTGKSAIARLLIGQYGRQMILVEASVLWGDSPNVFLGELLTKFGHETLPAGRAERFALLRQRLREIRTCLVIEEGHHLGPKCLNTLITILNQTPGEVIMFAMPSLWRRLESQAYEECRQLTGNRLAERIRLKVQKQDLEKMIARRLPKPGLNGEMKQAVALILQHEGRHGHYAFARDVLARLNENHEKGESVTIEEFAASVEAERESR